MLIKKGGIYRNRVSNIPCFIRQVKNGSYQVTWCFKSERGVEQLLNRPLQAWEEVIEGPDGYMEYRCTKEHSNFLNEIVMCYLKTEAYGNEDIFIMNWIPQHTFIAMK